MSIDHRSIWIHSGSSLHNSFWALHATTGFAIAHLKFQRAGLYQVLRTTAAVSRVAQMANALRGGESGSSTARRRLATLASHAAALARPSPQAVAAAASATSTGSSTASLGVVGAAHIARCTADVPALAAFYEKVLGFQRLVRPDFPFDGAWLRCGDFMLHIIEHCHWQSNLRIAYLAR